MPDPVADLHRRAGWAASVPWLLATALLLAALAGVSLWQERLRQHERAVAGTQDVARMLEAQVAELLAQADVLLQGCALQWRALAVGDDDATAAAAAAPLQALAATLPGLHNLRLADAGGAWRLQVDAEATQVLSPPEPLAAADAEARARWLAEPGGGLQVRGPLRRGPSAPWVLVLGRGVPGADGAAGGWVSVDLPVTRFDALFAAVDLGEHGAATLRHGDSLALVYSRPWPAEGMGAAVGRSELPAGLREALAANPQAGEHTAPAAPDGHARIHAYRVVQGQPLLLQVAMPEDEFNRGWTAVDTAIATLTLATLVLAGLAASAQRRDHQQALGAVRRQLAAVTGAAQDAIIGETLEGVVTAWNAGAERMFGHGAAEMLGQSLHRLLPAERHDASAALLARVQQGETVAQADTAWLHRDGQRLRVSETVAPLCDAQGRVVGRVRSLRDTTALHAQAEELRQLAFLDPLTRLPNRRLLMDRLRQAQQASQRQGTHAAVLFIDLDGLRQLNDRLGHEAGDAWLVLVADRLRDALRASDTVARLGGDEFVLLCDGLAGDAAQAEAHLVALEAKLAQALAEPAVLCGQPWAGRASIGRRLFQGSGDAPERLLSDAEQAMARQKALQRPAPLPTLETVLEDDSAWGDL